MRNDKKEIIKEKKEVDKQQREYYEAFRRHFIEFVSAQHLQDQQLKSILKKEYAIDKRI
jgi:DNA-binding transcriptional regulator YhcF (GntR family)